MPVVDYEGKYEVSDQGRVRSLNRFDSVGRGRIGSLMRMPKNHSGYPNVCLTKEGRQKVHGVHRLVLAAFVGPAPAGHVGGHLNGCPDDNRLINLAWITPKENTRQMHYVHHTGRDFRGEKSCGAKLKTGDVERIRESILFGAKRGQVAALFEVDRTTIYSIVSRKSWAHI